MRVADSFLLPTARPGERRIAVVGSGISGLASAWLLARRNAVTVFEAADYPGGHTHTVDVTVDGRPVAVDTGFLVFNRRTYPNLCALFALLDVQLAESDMSFSVSVEAGALEWAGTSLNTVFAQRRNLVSPRFLGMLRQITRFNRETASLAPGAGELPLGDYLTRNGYGEAFRDWYLLPMAAAIWSCPTRQMLDYPVSTFVRFCRNHGLLQLADRPQWLTVRGGAREYVRKLVAGIPDVRLSTPVRGLHRRPEGVMVHTEAGVELFDEVVLACHSDQALNILGSDASPAERAILQAIPYQPNRAVLHTDTALLPRRAAAWSSWNYLAGEAGPDGRPVSVSYLLNRLQPLPVQTPVILTLNPLREPAAAHVLGEFEYDHPIFDMAGVAAQARLSTIQGRNRTWFCGAWSGYGFHEDGLRSAIAAAAALGSPAPWAGATPERAHAV